MRQKQGGGRGRWWLRCHTHSPGDSSSIAQAPHPPSAQDTLTLCNRDGRSWRALAGSVGVGWPKQRGEFAAVLVMTCLGVLSDVAGCALMQAIMWHFHHLSVQTE